VRVGQAPIDEHRQHTLDIEITDLGQDAVPSSLGVAHVSLRVPGGLFQARVLHAEVFDLVLAEIGDEATSLSVASGKVAAGKTSIGGSGGLHSAEP
jgi:hypothetical protein